MPAIGDRQARRVKAATPKRKPTLYAPQIKARPVPPRAPQVKAKPRVPRAPTYAEQHYARAKVKQAARTERAGPKRSPSARELEPSDKAIERYKASPKYQKILADVRAKREHDESPFLKRVLKGAKHYVTGRLEGEGPPAATIAARPKGKGSFAALTATGRPGAFGPGSNAVKDVGELVVTTPTSVAHLAKTAATHPKKVPGMLADPYVQIWKHPVRELTERPASTLLTVAPLVKVPGLGLGRIARKTGKQTLERPSATLPGTALTEKRVRSRDVFVNRRQARKDREQGPARVTERGVHRRVDEFVDYAQQHVQQVKQHAAQEAKKQKMDPQTGTAHVEAARRKAKADMDEAFVREFGAHQRPAVGKAETEAARTKRGEAEASEQQAKKTVKVKRGEVKQATTEAKAARGTPSDRLATLEAEREVALRAVAEQHVAHTKAQLEHAKAHGSARVSVATTKTTPRLQELRGEHRAAQRATVTEDVTSARKAVSAADKRVAAVERQIAREEQKASQLEGITEGRTAAGRMTAGAGKRTADQAERIGQLRDVLHEARQGARATRETLKAVEHEARGKTRARVTEVRQAIGAERRRIQGVAPQQAGRLQAAIEGVEGAGAGVRAARQRVQRVTQQISSERSRTSGVPPEQMNRLVNALHDLDEAKTTQATRSSERKTAESRHKETKREAAQAPLISPKPEGRVFEHKSDANKVAERLNEAGHTIRPGGSSVARFELNDPTGKVTAPVSLRRTPDIQTPVEFTTRPVGDKWAVVPKLASERLRKHEVVGTSPATGAKAMRTSRQLFTSATLPLSLKWLFGQAGEAGVRSAIAGAGPLDILRVNKIVKQMNKNEPGSGDAMLKRISGGQFGLTGAARSFAEGKKTLAEEFAGGWLAQPAAAATFVGHLPGFRHTRAGWNRYSKVVLGNINGIFEQTSRKAMAGQAIKRSAFNEKRFNALSDAAIEDAANGLKGTDAQVQMARQVDRMYGQYQKFSPEMRSTLLHWTPFLPWYLNSLKFLFQVMPADHPILTSLAAAASTTTEDWRKENELSLRGESHVPDFMLGGYPVDIPFLGEGISRFSQYTPWGIGSDPLASAASLALPQALGPIGNALFNVDWTGKPLRSAETGEPFSKKERAIRAAVSAAEAQVPGVSQIGRLTGLTKRYIDKKDPEDIPPLSERLKKELPLVPIGGSKGGAGGVKIKPIKIKPIKVKPIKIGGG